MWSFQNNFLTILLISLVYVSYTYSEDNSEIRNCMDSMMPVFGLYENPLKCVQIAIRNLKLYGKNSYNFNKHVVLYYGTFYKYVNADHIRIPKDFCGSDRNCLYELSIFEDITVGDLFMMRGYSEEEKDILNNTIGFLGIMDGISEDSSEISYSEDSTGMSSSSDASVITSQSGIGSSARQSGISSSANPQDMSVKKKIVFNALYYHVIVKRANEIPKDETEVYFHKQRSNGISYMLEIINSIVVSGLDDPYTFCQKLYPRQSYNTEPATLKWK